MDKFGLYLRPFETDSGLIYNRPSIWRHLGLMSIGEHTEPKYDNLERQFPRALEKKLTVIAIGGTPAITGPGRVQSGENDWQSNFLNLSASAFCIFVVPLDNKWTSWEIASLCERRLIHKTLFLMPPLSKGYEIRARWASSRATFSKYMLSFPPYENSGSIFRLGRDGSPDFCALPFSFHRANAIRELIRLGYDFLSNELTSDPPTE